MAPKESNSDDIVVCHLEDSTSMHFTLRIQQGFSWTVFLRGVLLKQDTCPLLQTFPESLLSATRVRCVAERLTACHVCDGNSEEKFLKLSNFRRGVFTDAAGILYNKLSLQGGFDIQILERSLLLGVSFLDVTLCIDIML